MIHMKKYSEDFEDYYLNRVIKIMDGNLFKRIVKSSKLYLPRSFYHSGDDMRDLILAPYAELKEAHAYIEKNTFVYKEKECAYRTSKTRKLKADYDMYHDLYDKLRDTSKVKKISIDIVDASGIVVCPYCNRDYINCRGDTVSGVQLDHFYNRSLFPFFSLSLYNLVPVCGVCNLTKSDKDSHMVSPFDKKELFTDSIWFTAVLKDIDHVEVKVDGSNVFADNISGLKLNDAYQIHSKDASEIIEKAKIYTSGQIEEIKKMFLKNGVCINAYKIKKDIYGDCLDPEEFGKKPLSKFTYDLLKQQGVIE